MNTRENRNVPIGVAGRPVGVVVLQALWSSLVLGATTILAAEASLEERFLKEAPEKWREYRQIVARHTEGRAKGTGAITLGGETVCEGESEWAFALKVEEKRASTRIVHAEKGKPGAVEAFNPDYGFHLKPGRGGRWIIERLRAGATAVPEDLIGRHAVRPLVMGEDSVWARAMGIACEGQQLESAWFPRMVESPDFQLKRVTAVGSEGLAKVEFTFEPKEQTGGGASARSGAVVLDPKRYWLIREADTEASFNFASDDEHLNGVRGTLTIRNKLSSANMRVPYVSHQVCTAACDKSLGGKPWKQAGESTIDLRDVPEMDEKQFRLSGYGLPEPAKK